jgi:hypothetical protein
VAGVDAREATAAVGDLGKYDLSFDLSEPEAYRRDVPNAEVHVLDAGHFALDTKADEEYYQSRSIGRLAVEKGARDYG